MQKESEDTWISERFDVHVSPYEPSSQRWRILAQNSGWRGLEREPESWHIPRSAPLWTSCDTPASHPSPREASLSPQTITSPSHPPVSTFSHPHLILCSFSMPSHPHKLLHLFTWLLISDMSGWELLCSCKPKKSCCNISASPSATWQLQTVAAERNGALLDKQGEKRHAPFGKFLLMRSGHGITKKC